MVNAKNSPIVIRTIDTHTGGDPTRIVISGLPNVPGETMLDKKNYIIEHLDYYRQSLLLEPRGHKDMFGAILLDPIHPDADVGVVFMSNDGYLNMCGHGTMGVITAIIENGIIAYEQGNLVILETPAGLVKVTPTLEGNKVTNVAIENVPAFLWKDNVDIHVPNLGDISVDIAFGGSFFVFVDAPKAGISLAPSNHEYLAELGMDIIDIVNEQVKVEHPLEAKINKVELILFLDESDNADVNTKNVAVFGAGQVARSACGTGLCAQMATQVGKGLMNKEGKFTTESIIETPFFGEVLEETTVGNLQAIVPQINGNAFVTGRHEFILHPDDDLKYGFLLK